jgi:glyoxylase-like metal-dependent hydrolase (beta-lactamase superfamily II)/rhodanese-related sulfurtransferase
VLLFRQFVNDDLGCASYLVGDAEAGVAVVVDPPFAIEELLAAAEDEGVRIERVLETHTHADHVSGHGRLALEHGLPVAVHPLAEVEFESEPLADGEVLHVGSVPIRVLHTPGHRPEHCSFVVDERIVLTGDSLFVGDAARPDLAVAAREGAEDLYASLTRLAELPPDVEVYPGHVAGSLCGGNMSSDRCSTIGRERETNPSLSYHDVQDFVLVSSSVAAPKPPTTALVVSLNRGPWLARPAQPAELVEPGDATVLDVRDFAEHAAGHLPGAINVPVTGGSFGTKAGFVLEAGEPVVLHAASEEQALAAAEMLWAVGILTLEGFVLHSQATETLATVRPADLKELLEQADVQVVDVRETTERDSGYLPGSRNIPYRLIRKLGCGALERERPVVTICESGPRAAIAASLLQREGFDVRAVAGGGIQDFADDTVAFRRCGG